MRTIDTRSGYDRWAPTYDAIDNPLVAMTTVAMRRWALRDARRVLELGCGTGRNARFFLASGVEEYVGVDASPGMLAEARAKVGGDPRARFVEQDAANAGGLAGFDGVFVSLVLEHLEDPSGILRAAAEAAREGAWLRVYEIHPRLRERGARAHYDDGEGAVYLPSYAHDVAEIQRAMGARWEIVAATDWYASAEAVAASGKLARYRGEPVLLEVEGVRV